MAEPMECDESSGNRAPRPLPQRLPFGSVNTDELLRLTDEKPPVLFLSISHDTSEYYKKPIFPKNLLLKEASERYRRVYCDRGEDGSYESIRMGRAPPENDDEMKWFIWTKDSTISRLQCKLIYSADDGGSVRLENVGNTRFYVFNDEGGYFALSPSDDPGERNHVLKDRDRILFHALKHGNITLNVNLNLETQGCPAGDPPHFTVVVREETSSSDSSLLGSDTLSLPTEADS